MTKFLVKFTGFNFASMVKSYRREAMERSRENQNKS